MDLKCCGDRPSGAVQALDQSLRLLSSIVCDLWGLGLKRAHLEGKGLAAWEPGGIVGQHQRKPLQLDHWKPTWVTQRGFDKRKLCSGVARILFWRLEMLLGMSPLRDSWFPWRCLHHCQRWKGLRESPCAATTGEFGQHLVAARTFPEPNGPCVPHPLKPHRLPRASRMLSKTLVLRQDRVFSV